MSRIETLIEKLYRKPIPNDMRYDEIIKIAKHYGCITKKGGNHPILIVYKKFGVIIPIPVHGNHVKEAYIKELKDLFDRIKEEGQ